MSLSKMIMGQSGNQGSGASLDVDDVFSTFVYDGNSSTQTITNNIDLSNEGGLVWIKSRSDSQSHELVDTVRGNTKFIRTNSTTANRTSSSGDVTAFTSSGFSLGASSTAGVNNSSNEYVSWTWRKAPKYFDIVTYTGDNTAGRTISHSLESVPGMIWVKRTDSSEDWSVWHRNLHTNSSGETTRFLKLNSTAGAFPSSSDSSSSATSDVQAASSTTFTVGNDSRVNGSSATYVAYIFAHHNSNGGFGPSANQDIINCGSYTGAGSTDVDVNIGFEPQWLLIKRTSSDGANWVVVDSIRGVVTGDDDAHFLANLSNSEDNSSDFLEFTPTGFRITGSSGNVATNSATFIFMAIRRGPLAAPTSSSQVFAVDNAGSTGDGVDPKFRSGFPVDFALRKDTGSGNWEALTRLLQGNSLRPNDTDAEDSGSGGDQFDYMNGYNTGTNTDSSLYSWMWKRAPKYFDVVAYTGTGSNTTVSHNLGVTPEMMWIKCRSNTDNWVVFHKDIGATKIVQLNNDIAQTTTSTRFNDTAPTSSVFTVSTDNEVNGSGRTYIAYLFATVAGVSKIGTVAHSGSSTDVDCGFSNGSKFVLLKRTDATDSWKLFDSSRGIVSGNDPHVFTNTNGGQQDTQDLIDPLSSGFQITDDLDDGTYLFYAIAA